MKTLNKLVMLTTILTVGMLFFANLAAAAALNVKVKDGIGSYLVDEKGMALYLFKKDAPGKSACGAAGGCLERWPVFHADNIEAAAGIDAANIAVITRDDGLKQTTYKGQPLYYFFKDKDENDVYGQGVNNVWYVVAP
jgi:predicted lipoprotein with Yx(FWY)xxD motif